MRGALPHWLEQLLGIETDPGQGALWSLDASWGWAPWVTLLFCVFAVAWVVYFYAREAGQAGRGAKTLLVLIRLSLIALVLFMLAQVMISLQRTGLPYVVLVVDESASMSIVDRYEGEKLRTRLEKRLEAVGLDELTRLNLAKMLLLENDAELLSKIGEDYKLKVYFLAGAARAQEGELETLVEKIEQLEPSGETSRLGSGLRAVLADLRGASPAAVILLSDGVTTDGEPLSEAAAYARRKGVPLVTVGLGSERPTRDIELSDLLVDEVVFVDDVVNFQMTVTAAGFEGREVDVVLKERDHDQPLARTTITLGPDGEPQPVRLPYRPTEVGTFEYVVEIEPEPEEAQPENNRQQRVVQVRKERIRVLLAQAYPNYEFRYLKNMLERDPTIELHTVLQEADLEYAQLDQSALRVFPVRREELFKYDVLLFGDVNPAFLSRAVLTDIREFVSTKGGGVIFMAGPRYLPTAYRNTPLEELFPFDLNSVALPPSDEVVSEGFVVQPTDLGLASPHMQLGDTSSETAAIWGNLPPLYWLLETPQVKPAARVLATHPTQPASDGRKLPVFLMQYVGAGKVLFHATDETWRWRFRVGDVFFARYWVQSIRYLARSKLLGGDRGAELTVDRREYRRGEPVRVRVRFVDERDAPAADDGVTIMIEQSGKRSRRLTLRRNTTSRGIFEGVFTDATEGNYHLWMAQPTLEGRPPSADFLVTAPPGEFEQIEMDAAELARAAEQTRGHFYKITTAHKLLDELPQGRQVPVETLPPEVLWNRWWVLALFLTLLATEWIVRKRKGLL